MLGEIVNRLREGECERCVRWVNKIETNWRTGVASAGVGAA